MKRMKLYMDRKKLYIILCIILVCVFSLTLAYAALSVTLNVVGRAEVTGSNWNIYFDNPIIKNGSVSNLEPQITSNSSIEFSVEFNMPGDYYEFTIDVVNDGTIDAMIENIYVHSSMTAEQAKYLNGVLMYDNGTDVGLRQLLEAGESVRYRFRAEFKKDINASDLPTSSSSVDFSIELVYSQASNEAVVVPGGNNDNKEFRIVNGDLDTVGSEFCIDTECFYVLGVDGDYVMTLSKYNLYVGHVLSDMVGTSETPIYEELSDATGTQNSLAKGFHVENGEYKFPMYGGYPFDSDDNSLYSTSDIKFVVDDYASYISSLGYSPLYSLLMSTDYLEMLGCDIEHNTCTTSEYEWLYSTSYWTMSSDEEHYAYVVAMNGYIMQVSCYVQYAWGVRPVLIFEKSSLVN